MVLDGDASEIGGLPDQAQIFFVRRRGLTVINGKGTQNSPFTGKDRFGPAGGHARSRRQIPKSLPIGVTLNIANHDALLSEGGSAARANAITDLKTIDGFVIEIG
jgi:hypothetical protein